VAFRKHPTYVRKARNGYQLQRGVPKDIQPLIGKSVWVESGGSTYREAQRLSPDFAARTDHEIRLARGELNLSPDELTDALPKAYYLNDPEIVAALEEGASVALDEGWMTSKQVDRYLRVLHGAEPTNDHLTAHELIQRAIDLKRPAARTVRGWEDALGDFLRFSEITHPTACSRENAVQYRTELLLRMKASTVKTRLAYLGGLWSVLHELRPDLPHIFEGLNRRIRVERVRKAEVLIVDPDQWQGNQEHLDILTILYFTGARLAEVAGLCGEDIQDDRILIRRTPKRSLKTPSSEREIPIHPRLQDLMAELRGREGYLWSSQLQEKTLRWGVNLSKPSSKITGVSPKQLRDRAATVLRANGMNEAVVVRLLGHTPNSISMQYGAVPWAQLKKAVALL